MIRIACISVVAGGAVASAQPIDELPPGLYERPVSADLISTVRAALPEARAVGAEFLDPSYNPVITLSEQATVSVTFVDEGAGYRNSLAWLAYPAGSLDSLIKSDLDLNGNGTVSLDELSAVEGLEYGLVFPNASRNGAGGLLEAGDAVDLDEGREFDANTEILFCVLQNAWRNGDVRGYNTALNSTLSFYSMDMINPEAPADADQDVDSVGSKSRHVAMLFGDESRERIIMGFEDLHRQRNSDEDFNDAVFIVESSPSSALADSDIPDADPAFNPRPTDLFDNPDCCSVDTTQILEEELPERTNVNAEFLNPEYEPTIVLSEATYLVLSFVGEGAIYQNSLGYFSYPGGTFDNLAASDIDQNNDGLVEPWELRAIPGVELGMVFAHASAAGAGGALNPREAIILGGKEFAAGTNVGFFLVQDGWNDNRTVKDYLRDTGDGTMSFYTLDKLNPEADADKQRHVAMLFTNDSFESILFGFEDLHRTNASLNPVGFASDEDFNDNVFCISSLTVGALSGTNVPVAGDNCPIDYDNSGVLDLDDITHFIQAFLGQLPDADLVSNGIYDLDDIQRFIDLYLGGCS